MNWPAPFRLIGVIAAVALLLIVGVLVVNFDPFGRRKAAEARATAATAQAETSEATTQALDRYTTHTVVIRERADNAVRTVQAQPGASDPVAPDVLRAWRDGLRHNAPGASDHSPGDPPH